MREPFNGAADRLNPLARRRGLSARTKPPHDTHSPPSHDALAAPRHRLVYEECLRLQIGLAVRRRQFEAQRRGFEHDLAGDLRARFVDALPFALTGAQRRVITEIDDDLRRPSPMHRLLQGDVRSGKTVVATAA